MMMHKGRIESRGWSRRSSIPACGANHTVRPFGGMLDKKLPERSGRSIKGKIYEERHDDAGYDL
jgi:hypothetical protein